MIILLSGHIATGKSTLAELLHSNGFSTRVISTQSLIRSNIPGLKDDRLELQDAGRKLDQDTNGSWISRELAPMPSDVYLIDSVRSSDQIRHIRDRFTSTHRVVHVHLHASVSTISDRMSVRDSDLDRSINPTDAMSHDVEAKVSNLDYIADLCVDTERMDPRDVFTLVASFLHPKPSKPQFVDALIGGQYGSEGKGQVAAYISPGYDILVRVGGPNAGHKVWAGQDLDPHCFHHLPSGTRTNTRAKIVLGPGSVLHVPSLLEEISQHNVYRRVFIDPNAMTISNEDIEFESELVNSIGSTGQGVGVATARKVLRTRADSVVVLAEDDDRLRKFIVPTAEILEHASINGNRVFLEGTQGTSLSLHHGPYPYVTSRDTTISGCLADAGIAPGYLRKVVMVCRTHPIRVKSPEGGTSGPMKNELSIEEVADRSGIPYDEMRKTETTSTTKLKRRIGEFDWEQLHASTRLNRPTDIAVSFVDYFDPNNARARRISDLSRDTQRFIENVEIVAGAPVSMISTTFHREGIIDRRDW